MKYIILILSSFIILGCESLKPIKYNEAFNCSNIVYPVLQPISKDIIKEIKFKPIIEKKILHRNEHIEINEPTRSKIHKVYNQNVLTQDTIYTDTFLHKYYSLGALNVNELELYFFVTTTSIVNSKNHLGNQRTRIFCLVVDNDLITHILNIEEFFPKMEAPSYSKQKCIIEDNLLVIEFYHNEFNSSKYVLEISPTGIINCIKK